MNTKKRFEWWLLCLVVASLSEWLSRQFGPSTISRLVLQYVLPIAFSAIGLVLLFIAYYQGRTSR